MWSFFTRLVAIALKCKTWEPTFKVLFLLRFATLNWAWMFHACERRSRWGSIQGHQFRSYKTAWLSVIRHYRRSRNHPHNRSRPWTSTFSRHPSPRCNGCLPLLDRRRSSRMDLIIISSKERRMSLRNETSRTRQCQIWLSLRNQSWREISKKLLRKLILQIARWGIKNLFCFYK